MKFLLLSILIVFSFSSYAYPLTKRLYCSHGNDFALQVNVSVIDRENYSIKIIDQYFQPMALQHGQLTFNEQGVLQGIHYSATVQSLELKLINELWVGEYWFDNLRYELSCKDIKFTTNQ